jgi:hypothetical protein
MKTEVARYILVKVSNSKINLNSFSGSPFISSAGTAILIDRSEGCKPV